MVLPPPVEVPTAKVHLDPDNFRKIYELESLLPSIRQYGILQPPGLWADLERDCFFTIWGNRRVLCAQKLGLETLWARVFPGPLANGQADVFQLIENLQRSDLKPSEEAAGYRTLMERNGLSASGLADLLTISNAKVSKKLALLKLAPALLALIDAGLLPETSGAELAKVEVAVQRELAERFTDGATRQEVSDALRPYQEEEGTPDDKPNDGKKRHSLRRGPFSLTVKEGTTLSDLTKELDKLRKELQDAAGKGLDLPSFAKTYRLTATA